LKLCKQFLKGWDWNLKGEKKKRRDQIAYDLKMLEVNEELGPLNTQQLELRCYLMKENFLIIDEEELFWKQRAHENWLMHGDNEFIVLVMVGEEKNNIVFLEDGDKKIFGDENILEHATQYYVELFGPTPGNLFEFDMEVWNGLEKLDDTDNQILCGKFSEK
jgi:hypothetical protein